MLGQRLIISSTYNWILVLILLFTVKIEWTRSKEYQSCELLVELTAKHKIAVREAVKWTCLAEYKAAFNTNYVDDEYFGIFGIRCDNVTGVKVCDNTDCSLYLDDDITDDIKCARDLYGIGYLGNFYTHPKYNESDCENNLKKIVIDCFGTKSNVSHYIAGEVKQDNNNCTTNICDVMISASGKSLQSMLVTISANLDSILYDPCEAVYDIHKAHNISPRDIGAWACLIKDFIKCKQNDDLLEGDQDCKIVDCTKIESQYGIRTTFQFCTEVVEAINDSFELLNETVSNELLTTPNCLQWVPDTVTNRCFKYEHIDQIESETTLINDEQLIFNNMIELLDKEARGFKIEDINKLEVISNASYNPSTLDPCENLVVHFNTNISTEVGVSWLCFAREMINCFRREQKQCFSANCTTIDDEKLLADPDCDENIQIVADYVKINEEIILNTPERPLDDCRYDANLFLRDCQHHLSRKKLLEALQDITPEETAYEIYDRTGHEQVSVAPDPSSYYFDTSEDQVTDVSPTIPIDSNVIMSMGLALQVNESHVMVEETFDRFLTDPCHIKTLLDERSDSSEEYVASMFCFAYDVLWCSSNEAPLKCNVDCKTVRDNVIQDDTKCIERLNQIIMVGEKMRKILRTPNDEYSPNCMTSILGFIESCRVVKDENIKRDEPIYTRWAVRPTVQQRIVKPSNSGSTEASVVFSGIMNQDTELMTIRITTHRSTDNLLTTTESEVPTSSEPEITTEEQKLLLETMKDIIHDTTFDTVSACDLFRNSSASDTTEFTNTFCAIYENAWCKIINSDRDCEVSCSVFNFDDDSELCFETLEIMYDIANMWKDIFRREKLTYIPECQTWSKKNLERCFNNAASETIQDNSNETDTLDLPVLAGALPISDEEIQTQKANALAKERLCGIMRTFHDIYLIEEDQRPGWYCFAFDIFSCTIGRNRTVNCPVNCESVLDSFIKADENCEKRYNYVEEIAMTIDNKLMVDNHNIKPTDCRKDLRKILKVCDIIFDDYTTTISPDYSTLQTSLEESNEDVNFDQLSIESLKTSVTEKELIESTTFVTLVNVTQRTTTTTPQQNKSIDYQIFFPTMTCSEHKLFENITQDPIIKSSYMCFYIDYIFCTVNDPECAITCDSIEYHLIDRNACKDILKGIAANMDQFYHLVQNLTHIAEDCHSYYHKYWKECETDIIENNSSTKSVELVTTTTSTVKPETTQSFVKDKRTTTITTTSSSTEFLSSVETLERLNPPAFDFTESQEIQDDPIVCDKLYSLKVYLNLEPDTVISYYCFLQDYLSCKETEPDCDLNCRNVDDDQVRDTEACRKLLLSISRNRKHAEKYTDEKFTGSIEECKTRNSIACSELGDKYYITSTTVRTTTQEISFKSNVQFQTSERVLVRETTAEPSYEEETTTARSSSTTMTTTSTTTPVTPVLSTTQYIETLTTLTEQPRLTARVTDTIQSQNISEIIMTDQLNFCHLKEIFVRQLSNSDPSVLVSYFCFLQDYVSCLNESDSCQLDCETIDDEALRNTDLCRSAVTFVTEMRTKVPIIVTHRVDLQECKASLRNMFDNCDITTITQEIPTTTEIHEDLETTTIEHIEPVSEENVPVQIENSSGSLVVKQNSLETRNLADFFTIGIMHPKSMAKANFQIGLKEAQIKNIVITPDTENSNFNVAFTFHVDDEATQEKQIVSKK